MPRIAIAGFQHETNTFGASRAGLREFEVADSWPGLLLGDEVISGTKNINLPIAGFAAAALSNPGVELHPILWCAAEPSAHVRDDAFEKISTWIIDGVCNAGPIDGIYLDLHGAMVTETYDDGEGELLRRLRLQVGNALPISVSLDLHANVTDSLMDHASSISIFRTYPHLDMADTGRRSFFQLISLIDGKRFKKAFRRCPYLIPLHAQYTGSEPCRSLYADVERQTSPPDRSADLALGFTAADTPHTGPSIVAYAERQETADAMADELLTALLASEEKFDCRLMSPVEAVKTAMAMNSERPVVIADVQDNPGAGATSDTTGLLTALIQEQAQGALLGLMHDPEIASKAHDAGVGAIIDGELGGKSGSCRQKSYAGRFSVEALSDGNCKFTGAMYGGGVAVLGLCALLAVKGVAADVRVVVSSERSQCLDLGLFTHIGVDPAAAKIIGVKSTVHFRADFEPIADAIISTAAPGLFPCRLDTIPYQELPDGMRLGPLGPAFNRGSV